MKFSHRDRALRFRELHTGGRVLVLPNAWDVASACLIEDAGADAIATTSAGVAWSLGAADGNRLGRDRALDLVARIVSAVDVPVTADIESGYASDPDGVAETVRGVLAAGAVGINIEDGHAPVPRLRPVEEQCERIIAARRAADAAHVPMFLNARVDTYLLAVGDPATRLRDTVDRAVAYVGAGADGLFVPGVTDPETVSVLVREVPVPLNIMAGPGAPAIGELAELGVGRVSLGPAIALATHALVRRGVRELLTAGTYTAFTEAMDYGEVNALVDHPGETDDRPLLVAKEGVGAQ